MVNNTVNGRKIGSSAGIKDATILTVTAVAKEQRELTARGNKKISVGELIKAGEFLSIKAYPGGNPKRRRENEELTH